MIAIDSLLDALQRWKQHKDVQAGILQAYIQAYGPVPEEYGAIIRELMA